MRRTARSANDMSQAQSQEEPSSPVGLRSKIRRSSSAFLSTLDTSGISRRSSVILSTLDTSGISRRSSAFLSALDQDIDHYESGAFLIPDELDDAQTIPDDEDDDDDDDGTRDASPKRKARQHWNKVRQGVKLVGILQRLQLDTRAKIQTQQLPRLSLLVVVAACSAMLPTEMILQRDAEGIRMVVVANCLCAVVLSFVSAGPDLLWRRKIPLRYLAAFVVSNYLFNSLQSAAFSRGLPMPTALVVKNSGLLCQMLVGKIFLRTTYSLRQIASALVITIGIIVVVVFAKHPQKGTDLPVAADDAFGSEQIAAGILLTGILCRSFGNAAVELAYNTYGKQYDETMFYMHALGLPLFLRTGGQLLAQAVRWNHTREVVWGVTVPILWVCLAASVVLNYCSAVACTRVVGASSSVVLNLVLTGSRFLSVVISACWFHAPPYPPLLMWVGAALVVAGCTNFVLSPKL